MFCCQDNLKKSILKNPDLPIVFFEKDKDGQVREIKNKKLKIEVKKVLACKGPEYEKIYFSKEEVIDDIVSGLELEDWTEDESEKDILKEAERLYKRWYNKWEKMIVACIEEEK